MNTTDLSARIAKFRERATQSSGPDVQAEARHAAIASAVGARLGAHRRPAGHGQATTEAAHVHAAASRRRFARSHGG